MLRNASRVLFKDASGRAQQVAAALLLAARKMDTAHRHTLEAPASLEQANLCASVQPTRRSRLPEQDLERRGPDGRSAIERPLGQHQS